MNQEVQIANIVGRFFDAVDGRNWDQATSMMSDPIHIDYSSFGAGDPTDSRPIDVVHGWQSILPGFDHTHHQLGNMRFDVNGDRAFVEAYVTATHVIGAEIWTVVGSYEIGLSRTKDWLISSLRFLFKYQTGATALPEEASRRAKT